jgi:hypothetical protein
VLIAASGLDVAVSPGGGVGPAEDDGTACVVGATAVVGAVDARPVALLVASLPQAAAMRSEAPSTATRR